MSVGQPDGPLKERWARGRLAEGQPKNAHGAMGDKTCSPRSVKRQDVPLEVR